MTGTSKPSNLLLFTTSQIPLPVRYRHPHKPRLNLPPLVHRSLHLALDNDASSFDYNATTSTLVIPKIDTLVKHDDPPACGESDSETTLKMHLIAGASASDRAGWVSEALEILAEQKGLTNVDNLLVGWRGVDYKGKKTAASEFFGCGTEGLEGGSGVENVEQDVEDHVAEVWDLLRPLVDAPRSEARLNGNGNAAGHARKWRVDRLGTLYLPLGVLKRLKSAELPPEVNMLDTPDCHHLPHEYSGFARENGIELWAGGGGEGADPLPATELHNLLQEFSANLHLVESISSLGQPIPLREDELKYDPNHQPAVAVKWILGYTVLSKTRNVVQDKGLRDGLFPSQGIQP